MATKILVVEDEPDIQTLLTVNLTHAGYEVGAASDAETGNRHIDEMLPDLMLLDWKLPGMSGLEFMCRLRSAARTQSLPIIMLTGRVDEADEVQGLSSGADDYVTKPFSLKELLARIKALLRRTKPHMSGEILQVCDLQLDATQHRVSAAGRALNLSPLEFRLLQFFMGHTERLYNRNQLRDQVWGDDSGIEARTVDVHIRRLRAALEATGHDALIQTVRGSGYRFSSRPERECVPR